MPLLFSPLKIREVELKNRIVVSPMCEYSATDGFANDWHLVHLGSRAVGGAGLIITEATAVCPEGRITHGCIGLWKDEHMVELKRVVNFINANGSIAGIQLAHAGRKASHQRPWEGGEALSPEQQLWQTFASSAIPFKQANPAPKEMTKEDIDKVIADFTSATLRAMETGFKVMEIHAAHGYLINEFISPLTNKRSDAYGGSFENRVRILIEITEAIRKVWREDYPLFVRISATDWVEGGWTIEDSLALAKILKTKGVDLIDCSSGGNSTLQKIPVAPLYQVPFAEKIKNETDLFTGAVGVINTPKEAEQILALQQADLIFLARQLLRDPYFPLHAAKELGHDIAWPVQYMRAK